MNWQRVIEKYGWKSEEVGSDPFHPLAMLAGQARATGAGIARVSMSVSTSTDYSQVKVSCTVSIDCPQNDTSISMAGEIAFLKALELTNEGAAYIGIPELRAPA